MFELSVVIPTYNRAERLRACLDSLFRQTCSPEDYEIIVVVDGSTDHSRAMLATLTTPVPLRVIDQPKAGAAAARNRGAAAAHGNICLFLDDDMLATPELITEHIELQRSVDGAVGLGQIVPVSKKIASNFLSCRARSWQQHYVELGQQGTPSNFMNCYGGQFSVPRDMFLRAGGFAADIRRNHDIELAFRLRQKGLSFIYCSRAITFQCDDKGFRELTIDWERAGEADVEIYRRHPAILAHLKLGTFSKLSARETLLRRLFLVCRVSPRLMGIPFLFLRNFRLQDAWYRFLNNYCYWRGVRRSAAGREIWQRLVRGPVILNYHALTSSDRGGRFVLPVSRFAKQMSWLRRRGYEVASLDEVLNHWREYRFPPARLVVITFDDGYEDAASLAYPVLKRHGFPGTFFVVTQCVGGTNRWSANPEVAGRPLLSWEGIRELKHRGVDFGSHTRSHPALDSLPLQEVERELSGSRDDLVRELGCSRISLAYPYGRQSADAQAAAERAGFGCALGVEAGINDPAVPRFSLRRTEIHGRDSLLQFAVGVWLGKVPRLEKKRLA
jgi:peptidoglycan/xylan/chitin deacetylase (PgdA/CDA1 family)/GT2 family glycosyltransferase